MSANNLSVFGCDIDLIMGCGSSIGLVEIRWITIRRQHARTTTTVIMTMAPPKPLFRLNFLAREASFGSLVGVEALGGVESGLRLVEPAPRSPEEATIVATLQTVKRTSHLSGHLSLVGVQGILLDVRGDPEEKI